MATVNPQLLSSLMDTIPDRIYFKDRNGRFLAVNRAMREFFHIGNEEGMIGRTDFDFFMPEHAQDALDDEMLVMKTGVPIEGKIEREVKPDGSITWVSTTKVPMRDDRGEIIGTCGISRDVTEEHRKAEQLEEYTRALTEKQEQTDRELALAREVQQALLPQAYPAFPEGVPEAESALQFSHCYLPEGRVGGDFFTIFAISDTQAGVLICDVMGHGVHAALVTAVERVLVEELHGQATNPGSFLGELNRRLCHFFHPLPMSMFVTALYMVIDTVTGAVRFANAGHTPPVHLHRNRDTVRTLGRTAHPQPFALGVTPDSLYLTEQDEVQPGDFLLLFTDGLCELGEGKDLAPDDIRFLSLIQSNASLHGEQLLDAIVSQARDFSTQHRFLDDVCLVGIEIDRLVKVGHLDL